MTPDLADYSKPVQQHAALELSKMGPPCPRDVVIPGCSVAHRMVIDFGHMRDQTRAIINK